MKPVIVLTGSHGVSPKGAPLSQLLLNNSDSVVSAGGLPLLALDADESSAAQLAEQASGLYLTGGVDIHPSYYGEEKLSTCGEVDDRRDKLELLIGRAFLTAKKPVFAVCRGIQMLNVLFGGSLYQDLPSQLGLPHENDSHHPITTVPDTLLSRMFGGEFVVNSFHHQAILRLGDGLLPLAYSENGAVIEAVAHESLPVIGVQWHPERMTGVSRPAAEQGPDMLPLFQYFISLCDKTRGDQYD